MSPTVHRGSGILTTDAVVLRSVKYGDTSRILTLYTRECGRVAGILRGATRPGSRVLPALEPTARVNVVLYIKPGREVQTISQCDLVPFSPPVPPASPAPPLLPAPRTLDRISAAMQAVELVTGVTHGGEKNTLLFERLRSCLDRIDAPGSDPGTELLRFAVDLCGILGFGLNLDACAVCGRPIPPGPALLAIAGGGLLCASCSYPGGPVANLDQLEIEGLRGGPASRRPDTLFDTLLDYLRYHIPGFKGLRTVGVFRAIRVAEEPAGAARLLKLPERGGV